MATGDILATRIASATRDNGWVAEIDIDGLTTGGTYAFGFDSANRPIAPKIVFTVTSPGYDATGAPTTIQRTVYGTQWERKPTPNQAVADESVSGSTLTVRVSLSDFIYSGDTVTADISSGFYTKSAVPNNARSSFAVTNNSTLAHPKVVGRWAWPGWDSVSGTFTLEAVCFHRSARNRRPVAAVVFSVTDGTVTKNVTATSMSVSSKASPTGTGAVSVYKADFDATDFTQGAVLTANFTAYPWVGDTGAALTSSTGITPPDERLCPQKFICDKTGGYGGAAVVVDATNGNASTAVTWVAASQTAAESAYATSSTNSYQTIGHAVQALKAYNNANKGHNDAGGSLILLTGNHTWPGTGPADQGAQDAWVTITNLSTKTRAQCVINNGSTTALKTRRVKLYNVTLSGAATGQIMGNDSTNNAVLWVDQCVINMTGTAPFYQWRLQHATRNTVTALSGRGFFPFGADISPWALVRSNSFSQTSAGPGIECEAYCMLGNLNLRPTVVWNTSEQPSDNGIVAYNYAYYLNQAWSIMDPSFHIVHGLAIVQNLVEKVTATDPALSVAADGATAATNNVLLLYNTFVGERVNNGYNDDGTVGYLHVNWRQVGNLFVDWNNKDDTFAGGVTGANANRTGSWPVGYGVGHTGNHRLHSKNDPEWLGEFHGMNTITGGVLNFVSNHANDDGGGAGGTGTGGGDYHLATGASGLALVSEAVLMYDLAGNLRSFSNGDAGVYESQVALPDMTTPDHYNYMRLPRVLNKRAKLAFYKKLKAIGLIA